jgi:SAM-dependent methyltransferase
LDVGAGVGEFLSLAGEHFDVTGTEISKSAIALAKKKFQLELIEGAFETLSFAAPFDVITMLHVLEHVPSPYETLQRCRDWLNPGGYLVIAVPNDIDSILTRRNRLCHRWGWKKYQELGKVGLPLLTPDAGEIHLSHFRQPVLEGQLKSMGFSIVESGLDPYFVALGVRRVRRYLRMWLYQSIFRVSGANLYDCLWVTARKA